MAASVQNASIDQQLFLYKKYMTKLTTEREGLTEARKKQKQEKIYQMSKKVYSIVGDDAFAKKIDTYFKEISSVKPGRKLIKALEKTHYVLKIKPGKKFAYGHDDAVHVDPQTMSEKQVVEATFPNRVIWVPDCERLVFNALGKNGERLRMRSPSWICFAHELIHGLHIFSDYRLFAHSCNTDTGILLRMTDLEEQYAITAWNPLLFTESNRVNKDGTLFDSFLSVVSPEANDLKTSDFLCENAFYMALGLPVRIDHRLGDTEDAFAEKPESYDAYYAWLENEIKNGYKIPQNKKNDSSYLADFLINYPEATQAFYLAYKHNQEFLLDVYIKMKSFKPSTSLSFMPDLAKDPEFVFKAMRLNIQAFGEADPELRKSKDFVLKVINNLRKNSIQRHYIYDNIDPTLAKDPEIIKKLDFVCISRG